MTSLGRYINLLNKRLVSRARLENTLDNMFTLTSLLVVASAAVPQVLAHGGVLAYSNAGNWFDGWYAAHPLHFCPSYLQ